MSNNPQELADIITKNSNSNFYYSFFFLNAEQRKAIHTVYSFCRISDDIVDSNASIEQKKSNLQSWRDDLVQENIHLIRHPILKHIRQIIERFHIPFHYFTDIIRGMEMDLQQVNYRRFSDLKEYAYYVASVVGLICIEIFQYKSEQTKEYASELGLALQLTNITRDAHEDSLMDRFYLPEEDFIRFSYSHQDLKEKRYNNSFINMMKFQCERAKRHYENANSLLAKEDRKRMLVPEIMNRIYAEILKKIESEQYNIFDQRVSLSKTKKLSLSLQTYMSNLIHA